MRCHYSTATGPCAARSMAQQLWMGEEYVLQIDAHMRFVQVRTVRVNKCCDSGKINVIMSREQQYCMLA